MKYTEQVDGICVADVVNINEFLDKKLRKRSKQPKKSPTKYAIEKTEPCEPFISYNVENGKPEMHNTVTYVIGWLQWDRNEACFEFYSVGLRWLEAKPSEAAVDMILTFAAEKAAELSQLEEDIDDD